MKIFTNLSELATMVSDLKKQGKTIVFTNGCFDILHLGHIRYLEEAKKLGDYLIVGINSDASVRTLKGKNRPVVPEEERAEILGALRCVDYVIIFSEGNPENVILQIHPDVHAKGGDYTIDRIPEAHLVESLGGKTIILQNVKGKSTTNIVQKILSLNEVGDHDKNL